MKEEFSLLFRRKKEILARIAADALLVSLSLIVALTVRYLNAPPFGSFNAIPTVTFEEYLLSYGHALWVLVPLAIAVLYLHGIYTHGRSYSRRAKIFLILRAVSVAYLLVGFGSYFLAGAWYIPRGALAMAWMMTCALTIAARLWAWLWVISSGYGTESKQVSIDTRRVERVLVIGGAGYIGSEVVRLLIERGYTVRVLDILIYGIEPLQPLVGHPRLEIVRDDFRRIDTVVEAMRGVDAVIHLGAIVGDPACALDEDLTIQINLTATRMIAEVAKGHGVNRFLFASSCSVYGASDEVLNEQSALNPVSLYARSKIASEQVLQAMADARFAPVILRFGTIYGLSGRTRFDLVVNLMSAKALFEGRIDVFGGDQWRPFVHVSDAARAVVQCLERPLDAVRNQAFNVGSDAQNLTIRQAAELVAAHVPGVTINERSENVDRRNYRVSFGRIGSVVGFAPAWTLDAGVQQVIDAIRAGRVVDYREPKYNNALFLSDEVRAQLGIQSQNWDRDLIRQLTVTAHR